MDRTLIVIKPDGVGRGLTDVILRRFESDSLKVTSKKSFRFTLGQAKMFYSPHAGKNFFQELISFITSGPVVAAVLEGPNALERVREIIGPTDPGSAPKGTIRGDFGTEITSNVVHAADSPESFAREWKVVFG